MVFGCIEAYFILFRFETMKEKKTNKIMNSKIVLGNFLFQKIQKGGLSIFCYNFNKIK